MYICWHFILCWAGWWVAAIQGCTSGSIGSICRLTFAFWWEKSGWDVYWEIGNLLWGWWNVYLYFRLRISYFCLLWKGNSNKKIGIIICKRKDNLMMHYFFNYLHKIQLFSNYWTSIKPPWLFFKFPFKLTNSLHKSKIESFDSRKIK